MKRVRLKRFPMSARQAALSLFGDQKRRLDEKLKKAVQDLDLIDKRIENGPARKHEVRRREKKQNEIDRIKDEISKAENGMVAVAAMPTTKRGPGRRRL